MPTFIAAAALFLVEAGVPVAVLNFAVTTFVYAATSYLIGRVNQALAPRNRNATAQPISQGLEVAYYSSEAGARVVYGEVRMAGMETIPPFTSGDNFEMLHKVFTLAAHEVNTFTGAYFNTSTISVGSLGPQTYTNSDGAVITGAFSGHAWLRFGRGTSTDSADAILVNADSTRFAESRGRGIAKARVSFLYNRELWTTGVPDCTFVVQGKKCYDPRLDSSPGANPTNPSYIAFTKNGVLHTVDFLMSDYGGSYTSTDIDWDTVVTAANTADGAVNIPGATTQARYTFNGVLDASAPFTDNLKELVNSYLGRLTFTNGKWRVWAGSWQAATTSIDKTDFTSPVSIQFEGGRKVRFNRMSCWYVDPSRNWQLVQCYPRSNSTYATADFETIDAEVKQAGCTNEYEAQRKAEFLLRASRNQVMLTGKLPPRLQNVALWDTVSLTWSELGWASKTFRVTACDLNSDGSIDVALLEEQSSDWTDLAAGDYGAPSTAALPSINPTIPSEPRNLAAYGLAGSILVDWDDSIVRPIGTRYRLFMGNSNYPVGAQVWDGDVTKAIVNVDSVAPRYFWAQAYAGDQESDFTPSTYGISATAQYILGVNSPSVPSSIPVAPPTITGVSNFQMGYAVGGQLRPTDTALPSDNPAVQAQGTGTFSYQWSVFSLQGITRSGSYYNLPNSSVYFTGANSNYPIAYVQSDVPGSYHYILGGIKAQVSNTGGTATNTSAALTFWRK